jgi:heptosyltransferase-2
MKILIIKLGLSETLDPEVGRVSSLGDILRTTPILPVLKEKYPESKITWLVDESPYALLKDNPYIDKILLWDSFVGFQLMTERFDIVINLEKIGGLCAVTNRINAWKKYGFRFDENSGSYGIYDGSEYALELCTKHEIKKNNNKTWQQVLIEMIGGTWNEQPYILGYKPKTKIEFDVGFNHKVGPKFPDKMWDEENWIELEKKLVTHELSVSWQQGLNNLYDYIDWINSCKIIVSCDSLGLHIALALNKPVIALFGPTNSKEVYMYGLSMFMQKHSMKDILPIDVYKSVISINNKYGK